MSGAAERHQVEVSGVDPPALDLLFPLDDLTNLQLAKTEDAPVILPGRTLASFIDAELEAANTQQLFLTSGSQNDLYVFDIARNTASILDHMRDLPGVDEFISEEFQADLRQALQIEAASPIFDESDAHISETIVPRMIAFTQEREQYDRESGRLPEYSLSFYRDEIALSAITQSALTEKRTGLLELRKKLVEQSEPEVLSPLRQEEVLFTLNKAAAMLLAVDFGLAEDAQTASAWLLHGKDTLDPDRHVMLMGGTEVRLDHLQRELVKLERKETQRENAPEITTAQWLLRNAEKLEAKGLLNGANAYAALMMQRHDRGEERHVHSGFPKVSYGSDLPVQWVADSSMNARAYMEVTRQAWRDQVNSRDAAQLASKTIEMISEHIDPNSEITRQEQACMDEAVVFIVSNWGRMSEAKRYEALKQMARFANGALE